MSQNSKYLSPEQKKEVMLSLDPDMEFKCVYGIRREDYNITSRSISGFDSSGNYKIFSVTEDEIDFDQLHSISIAVDLFNHTLDWLDKVTEIISGIDNKLK